ncbi:oligosaccharide flippase family protein [Pseudoalteromonas piscicida]|uniref:oligosaccharide flippase family protein n=1 Tax=Pseudoalteromonas piscicida TaxID=43662 RepID=UPI0032C0C6A7
MIFFIALFSNRVLNFILIPLFAFLSTPDETGLFIVFVAYQTFLSLATKVGGDSYIATLKMEYEKDLNGYYLYLKKLAYTLSKAHLVGLLMTLSFGFFLYDFKYLISLFFSVIVLNFILLLSSHYRVSENKSQFVMYSLVAPLFGNVIFFTCVLFNFNFVDSFLARSLFISPLIFLFIFKFKKIVLNNFEMTKKMKGEYMHFGGPLIVHGLFMCGLSYLDRFFINYFYGSESVAYYSIPYSIASALNIFFIVLLSSMAPLIIKRLKLRRSKITECVFFLFNFCYVLFLLVVLLTSEKVIYILYGEVYSEKWFIAPLSTIAFGVLIPYYTYINYLFSQSRTKLIAINSGIALFVNFIIIFAFGGVVGLENIPYLNIVSNSVMSIILLFFIGSEINKINKSVLFGFVFLNFLLVFLIFSFEYSYFLFFIICFLIFIALFYNAKIKKKYFFTLFNLRGGG